MCAPPNLSGWDFALADALFVVALLGAYLLLVAA